MPMDRDQRYRQHVEAHGRLTTRDLLVLTLFETLEVRKLMATQADVDALAARIDTATTALTSGIANIRQDIADLKAANPGVDTTALEASVGGLETELTDVNALDAENPAPPTP